MKPLFSALLEALVFIAAVLLIFLGLKIFKYESPYDNYAEQYPDRVITISNALGYVPDGTVLTPEETAAEVGKHFFGQESGKRIPVLLAKFYCIEISPKTARVLEFYPLIVFVESILCLIFGITLPCSLYRHLDPAKAINGFFIRENLVYTDDYGRDYGHVGETRAGIVRFLLFLLMLFITNIVCSFLPLIIVVNFVIGIVMAILYLVGVRTSSAIDKAKVKSSAGKSGKETYRIIPEHGLFMVTGDIHPNRSLYFNEYWNAVIAQRILELDEDYVPYLSQDAVDTITYGDENVHKKYEVNRVFDIIKQILSKKERDTAFDLEKAVKNRNYVFSRVQRGPDIREYIIMMPDSDKYMLFRLLHNCSIMEAVMTADAKKEVFDMIAWNGWERMTFNERNALLSAYKGSVNPPEDEEIGTVQTQ